MQANKPNNDSALAEFSMNISKVSLKDGEMRWRAVASDTGEDYYGEKMSVELFKNFVDNIAAGNEVPMVFRGVIYEDGWQGGMPYVSIAHYKSGANKVNVPGEPKNVYLDGECLKATGVLYDTPLGQAVFRSLKKDLVEKRDDKVRISIGFLDLEHSHGEKFTFVRKALTDKCPLCKEGVGDKIYKKGHLVHLALTRVPANPRTDVEVERSMTTKREDAESIVEDEEVLKGLDLKSQAEERAEDLLVVKAEEECEDDMDGKKKKEEEAEEKSVATPVENTVVSPEPVVAEIPVPEPTPIEKSFAALQEKILAIKSQGLSGEEALKAVQGDFENVGNVIKAEFTPPPSPEEVAKQNLETTLRSLLNEMLPSIVAPIQSKLESLEGELRAKSLTTPLEEKTVTTVQRSLPASVVQRQAVEKVAQKVSTFDLIARQSVGLQ